jgi:hypothetical protein
VPSRARATAPARSRGRRCRSMRTCTTGVCLDESGYDRTAGAVASLPQPRRYRPGHEVGEVRVVALARLSREVRNAHTRGPAARRSYAGGSAAGSTTPGKLCVVRPPGFAACGRDLPCTLDRGLKPRRDEHRRERDERDRRDRETGDPRRADSPADLSQVRDGGGGGPCPGAGFSTGCAQPPPAPARLPSGGAPSEPRGGSCHGLNGDSGRSPA